MIAQFSTKLIAKECIAQDTYQFIFEKPADFDFLAGQYVFLDFPDPQYTDDRPSMRAMSIASAPQEDTLMFIMRSSDSAFKKNITAMTPGEEITVKGPIGHIALPDNVHQPIAFIISGVGVTAARSMIMHEQIINSPRKITMLYSSRTKDSIALREELDSVSLQNYAIVHTLTRENGAWDGEAGRINRAMIERHIDDIQNTVYYVVGAGTFIDSMRDILGEMGIDKLNVHFDNFG